MNKKHTRLKSVPKKKIAQVVDEIATYLQKHKLSKNPEERDKFESRLRRSYSLKVHLAPTMNARRVRANPEIMAAYKKLVSDAASSYLDFITLKELSSHWVARSDIPSPIKEWLGDFLEGNAKQPPKKKAKKVDFEKRMALAVAAFMVIDEGYPAGKNDQSTGEDNAFSIVAKAANKAGWQGVTNHTVRDYFYAMQHLK